MEIMINSQANEILELKRKLSDVPKLVEKDEIEGRKDNRKGRLTLELDEEEASNKDLKDFNKSFVKGEEKACNEIENIDINVLRSQVKVYEKIQEKAEELFRSKNKELTERQNEQIIKMAVPKGDNELIKIRESFRIEMEQGGMKVFRGLNSCELEEKKRQIKIACSKGDEELFDESVVEGRMEWIELGKIALTSSHFEIYQKCFYQQAKEGKDEKVFLLNTLRNLGPSTNAQFIVSFLKSNLGTKHFATIAARRFENKNCMQRAILEKFLESGKILEVEDCKRYQQKLENAIQNRNANDAERYLKKGAWDLKRSLNLCVNSSLPSIALKLARQTGVPTVELAYKACKGNQKDSLSVFLSSMTIDRKGAEKLKEVCKKDNLIKLEEMIDDYLKII
jgi:hypothetical protein